MKPIPSLGITALVCLYAGCIFAIISPALSLLTNNSVYAGIGVTFVITLALISVYLSYLQPFAWTGIFSYMSDDEEGPKWWMRIHVTFILMMFVFFMFGIFSFWSVLYYPIDNSALATQFMVTVTTVFFSVIGMWGINRVIGMGYKWLLKGEFLGIISFSGRAGGLFSDKNPKGIWYLLSALLMFQEHLKRHRLENEQLTRTISILRSIYVFRFKIPYEDLRELAFATARLPSIESFESALSTFNASQTMKWADNFKSIENKKRAPIEWVAAVAAIIAALTFLPESTRTVALSYVTSWSVTNIFVLIGFSFFFTTAVMFLLDREYRANPLKDYATSAFDRNSLKTMLDDGKHLS
jgi:hypothetical protein